MRLAAVTAIIGFFIPAPAAAEDPDEVIALSADGVAFTRELPAPLFAGARIVPGSTVTRSFWVLNQEGTPGNLALALQDVAGPDVLMSGLSAAAAAGPASGSVAFADAAPCATILSAVPVPASGAVLVEVSLSLADLDGLEGQGSTGEFALRVTLSSGDSVVIVGSGGDPDSARPESSPRDLGMNGNTDRLYQEYFVAAWLAATLLGGACAWGRHHRHDEEDA